MNPYRDAAQPWEWSPKCYAGVGSRKIPAEIWTLMTRMALRLAWDGWTLRTGAAAGSDTAFEHGAEEANGTTEIYLPWINFRGRLGHLHRPTPEAIELAARHHPNWRACSPSTQALMGRTSHVVLGPNLDSPVAFVLCWTPDGAKETTTRETGGTGQAIRVARAHDIEVFNLAAPKDLILWQRYVEREQ